MGFSSSGGAKVGTIELYGGTVAPNGWLFCDGGSISRTLYSDLFAVIGTNYGGGDGSTTFALPNYTNARFVTSSNIAVKGNGKALGLTNGDTRGHFVQNENYVLNTGTNADIGTRTGNYVNKTANIGVDTDASLSGLVGTVTIADTCKFIIKY